MSVMPCAHSQVGELEKAERSKRQAAGRAEATSLAPQKPAHTFGGGRTLPTAAVLVISASSDNGHAMGQDYAARKHAKKVGAQPQVQTTRRQSCPLCT